MLHAIQRPQQPALSKRYQICLLENSAAPWKKCGFTFSSVAQSELQKTTGKALATPRKRPLGNATLTDSESNLSQIVCLSCHRACINNVYGTHSKTYVIVEAILRYAPNMCKHIFVRVYM